MAGINKNRKAELAYLRKTQEDLRQELSRRGYDTTPFSLSRYLSGERIPQDPHIMAEIDMIIAIWKKEVSN